MTLAIYGGIVGDQFEKLDTLRMETSAAADHGLIRVVDAQAILTAEGLLRFLCRQAIQNGVERVRSEDAPPTPQAGPSSPLEGPGSLDSETLVLHEGGKGDAA